MAVLDFHVLQLKIEDVCDVSKHITQLNDAALLVLDKGVSQLQVHLLVYALVVFELASYVVQHVIHLYQQFLLLLFHFKLVLSLSLAFIPLLL